MNNFRQINNNFSSEQINSSVYSTYSNFNNSNNYNTTSIGTFDGNSQTANLNDLKNVPFEFLSTPSQLLSPAYSQSQLQPQLFSSQASQQNNLVAIVTKHRNLYLERKLRKYDIGSLTLGSNGKE
ncbi:22305_t:CDS:2 [Entrophospora sp. SA101]|nr:7530_t:CDS:2 [Entrophospora sp. SA101]CAJ0746340.1 22305_t:CDS:2 [Entrophospora sp. SA101]CAJ0895248.1 5719_t:CDS:2 [Entrophospora sp. SA101]CAJ0913603.1 12620_t:CDS:2 [Entrophospora sp. SA101]